MSKFAVLLLAIFIQTSNVWAFNKDDCKNIIDSKDAGGTFAVVATGGIFGTKTFWNRVEESVVVKSMLDEAKSGGRWINAYVEDVQAQDSAAKMTAARVEQELQSASKSPEACRALLGELELRDQRSSSVGGKYNLNGYHIRDIEIRDQIAASAK